MVARAGSGPWLASIRSWDNVARELLSASVEWRIHSVFSRACNLISGDGELLGIVQAPARNGPATIVLAPRSLPGPLTELLRPLDRARRDGHRLCITSHLVLDLSGAHLWTPAPIVRSLDAAESAARLDRVADLVRAAAPPDGLAPLLHDSAESPLLRRARVEVEGIVAAIRTEDWRAVLEPARRLSGLGPGLTPSGDDLLAGLALGFSAARGGLPVALAMALVAAVNGCTTALAEARVQHAVAERPDEAVHRLLTLLVGSPGPMQASELDAAVRAVLDYGHSSGADTLVGLIVGARLGLEDGLRASTPAPPTAPLG